jgi:hypothetical protein
MTTAAPAAGTTVSFRATILLGGKTATGIRVPDDVVQALGSSKRPRVHATINDYAYRSTVAPMRGNFMLPVSAEVRDRAHVQGGDEVAVTLTLDTEPRVITIPPDFAQALAEQPPAQDAFTTLSYSNQQRFVLSIEGAKTQQTRERRIAKTVATLREERA